MSSLVKLKGMICDELDGIAESGELTPSMLETVDKLTHSLKSIETILAMKGDTSKESAVDKLKSLMSKASSDDEREALKEAISKMEG